MVLPSSAPSSHKGNFGGGGLYGVLPNYNFDFQTFGYANSEKTRDFLYLKSEKLCLGSV